MEHTPGPWEVTEDLMHVYAPDTDTAITNDRSFCYPNHAEAEANARLIAAAPELLAACEAAEQCIADFLDVYTRGCSMQVLDLAVRDLKAVGCSIMQANRIARGLLRKDG